MDDGWFTVNGDTYYAYPDGHLATGTQVIDGEKCTFTEGPDRAGILIAHTHKDINADGICDICERSEYIDITEPDYSNVTEKIEEEIFEAIGSQNPEEAISNLYDEGKLTEDEAEILKDAADNSQEVDVKMGHNIYVLERDEQHKDHEINVAFEEIAEAVGADAHIGEFIDILVYREIFVDSVSAGKLNLTNLPEPMKFTVVLPYTPDMPEGNVYDWKVYRYHDGEIDIIDIEEVEHGIGVFYADKFSVYAIVYTDVTETENPENPGGPGNPEEIETVPMYRLYNPNSGEHFYTGSIEERDNLVTAGWHYEGIAWNAPVSGGTPIHRVFNPNSGDHHYTASQEEIDNLVSVGWIYEGVAWNSAHPTSETVPQYRLYNPNADCGSHHYTGSEEERDFLVSLGWHYEGIGWYGTKK